MIILDEEKFEPLLRSFQIEMSAQTTLLGQILAVNMEMFSSYQERIQDIIRTEELQKATEPLSNPVATPDPSPLPVTQQDNTNTVKDGAGLGLLNASALKDILFGDKSLFGAGIGGFLGKSVKSLGGAFLLGFGLLAGKEFVEGMFEVDIDKAIADNTNGIVELDWKDATSLAIGKVVGGPIGAVSAIVAQNLTDAFEDLSGIKLPENADIAIAGITSLIAGNKSIAGLLMRVLNPYTFLVAAVAGASVLAWQKFDALSAELDKQDIEMAKRAIESDDIDVMTTAQQTLKASENRLLDSESTPELKKISQELDAAIVKKQVANSGISERLNDPESKNLSVVDKEKDMNIVRQAAIEKINAAKTDQEVIAVLREAGMYAVKYGLEPSEAIGQLAYSNLIDPEQRAFVQEVFGQRGNSGRVDMPTMEFLRDNKIGGQEVQIMTRDGWLSNDYAINPNAIGAAESVFGTTTASDVLGIAGELTQPSRPAAAVEAAIISGPQISVSNSHNTIVTNATTSNMSTRGGGSNGPIIMGTTQSPDKSIMMYNMGR